jgi:outer membrane protein
MKYINMLLLSFIALGLYAQQKEVKKFSLQEAVSFARSNNNTVKNSRLDVDAAQQKVREVTAMGLPNVNASGGFTHNIKIPVQVFPNFINAALPPGSPRGPEYIEAAFGIPYSATGSITASQLIFDGTFLMGLKASKEFVNLSRISTNRTEIETEVSVSKAYYMALMLKTNVELINKNQEALSKTSAEMEALSKSGLIDKIESDRIKLQLNNLNLQLSKVNDQYWISLMMLKFQMGLNVNDSIVLTDNLTDLYQKRSASVVDAKADYSKRQEYQLLKQQEKLNTLDKKRYQYAYAPSLSGFFTHQQNSFGNTFNELGNRWFPGTLWGLNLRLPIFEGFKKQSQIQQTKIALMKNKNDLTNLENAIEQEVFMAKSTYVRSNEQIKLQQQNLDLAQEVYNRTETKYKNGVGSSLELTTSQNDLETARANYLNTLYEFFVADLDLQKALGNIK